MPGRSLLGLAAALPLAMECSANWQDEFPLHQTHQCKSHEHEVCAHPHPPKMPGESAHDLPTRPYSHAGGIVFCANSLKFCERARTEWHRFLGTGQQALREQTGGMLVVTHSQGPCLRPARQGNELIVTAQLQEAGRASLTILQHALLKPEHDMTENLPALINEGTLRIGWVDAASLRPARIPSTLLEQLSTTP